jgi:hypothetical protein
MPARCAVALRELVQTRDLLPFYFVRARHDDRNQRLQAALTATSSGIGINAETDDD